MQPIGIESIGLRKQRGDLFGEPRADGIRAAPGCMLGAIRQRGNLSQPGG